MGNVSPVTRLASRHGITLATNTDLGVTIASINGHDFSGATPKDALDAAMASLRNADVASMAPPPDDDNPEAPQPIPPEEPKKKKPRVKKAKKGTAPKKKKRVRTREEDEEEAEEGSAEEVVRRRYRMRYAETDNHCNDAMAVAFYGECRVEGEVSLDKLKEIAAANAVDLGRWRGRNIGMIRMNLGNVLRGKLRHGEQVKIGKQTFKPEKSNGSKKA